MNKLRYERYKIVKILTNLEQSNRINDSQLTQYSDKRNELFRTVNSEKTQKKGETAFWLFLPFCDYNTCSWLNWNFFFYYIYADVFKMRNIQKFERGHKSYEQQTCI